MDGSLSDMNQFESDKILIPIICTKNMRFRSNDLQVILDVGRCQANQKKQAYHTIMHHALVLSSAFALLSSTAPGLSKRKCLGEPNIKGAKKSEVNDLKE